MKSEYRIIFTATFDTIVERDKAYNAMKTAVAGSLKDSAVFKRADMKKDEYMITDVDLASEKVI